MNPTGLSMKKKKELDARTKEYKLHRRKLKMQRERRMKKKEMLKGSFTKGIKESMNKLFESFVKIYDNDEEEVKRLKLLDIVKTSKSIRVIKQSKLHYTVTIRML